MIRNAASPCFAFLSLLVSCILALSPFLSAAQDFAAPEAGSVGQTAIRRPQLASEFSHATSVSRNVHHANRPAPGTKLGQNQGPIFFNPASYASGGVYAFGVSTGDFNRDGNLDLVVANECPENSCNTGSVGVLMGNGDGTFQAAQSYGSGGDEAYAVAVGDLKGDGKADVVVANGCQSANQCANGVVGVLLGKGDGTFKRATSYSSGGYAAVSVALADLRGNGKLDIVVANECEDNTCANGGVSVLLNNGDGTFQPAQAYATGGFNAVAVAIADFSGDGKPDLAVANQCESNGDCNGTVGILLGNGDGTFQPVQTYSSGGYNATSLTIANFGNGTADLAVTNQCQSSEDCGYGNVGVLLGNGDGTFQSPQSYVSGGNNTAAVVVANLTANGPADLVLANQCQIEGNCTGGTISLLLGNGDGTFQAPINYFADGAYAESIATGDWNGDGNTGLALVNQCQAISNCSGTVTVFLGNGNNTLQAPSSFASGGYNADSVATGDLNGDGNLDLVVANFCKSNNCTKGTAGTVGVLLGNGDGTFQTVHAYDTEGFGSSSVALTDLNHDGNLDVIVANQCTTSNCQNGGSVSVFLGNGDGNLHSPTTYSTGAFASMSVAVGDFNNDGIPDLAIADQCQDDSCQNGAVSILIGNGDGTFKPAQIFASAGYKTNSVATGDFNGNGNLDLAVTSQCQDNTCQNGGVSVLLGNGDGTFQPAQSYSTIGADADAVAVADLKGNGNLDLVVVNRCQDAIDCENGLITSLTGFGNGTFKADHKISSGGQYAYSVTTADFNGDGIIDAVVSHGDVTCVLLGNGDGSFQTAIPYYPDGIFVAEGDFNGDHQPDVAIAGGALSTVTPLLNIVVGYRQVSTTTLTSSPDPSAVYQSVLFTATVSSPAGGSPTGTVTFKSGATELGQGNVSNGQATLNYAFTTRGQYSVTASYSGDSNYLPSTSAPIKQNVLKASTTTTLTSMPNPSNVGQTVTFTATVTGQYGGTPTGMVTFKNDGSVMAQVPLTQGVAQYQTSNLTKGKHHIVADYSGDSNFHPSVGSLIQIVN